MSLPNGYILENVNIATLSVFDLLKHTQDSNFMDRKDFGNIYPLSLELNTGFFTKNDETVESPHVSVNQGDNTIISVCSCNNSSEKLCEHQAEVIYCILEKRDFRIFYDKQLRHKILLQSARGYGLENEADLDVYFLLRYEDGKLHVEKKVKELLSFDGYAIENNLIPKQRSVLVKKIEEKKQLLVISRHRYYNQLNFLLMESACTKSGKIKNPLTNIDPLQAIWKSDHALEVKFYTAILAFQNKYSEDNFEIDHEALKAIVANPLGLPIYYHDRDISETISAKSLLPVAIGMLKAEIQLTVFKKEPFYEITGELIFQDVAIPFKNITLRYDYFVYHHQAFYLVDNPDMLRLIKFFKANHEILLIHASKYEEFIQTTLASLEEFVHINYTYIHTATSVQLEEKEWAIQPIIYLQQQGSFIYITPVMQYGVIEVPVYSKKQLFDRDRNGNEFKIERNKEKEIRLTSIIMEQHSDFKEQLEEQEYFYLHKDRFLEEDWFLDAFDVWVSAGITVLGFNEIKDNNLNPFKAKINIEVHSGEDWFNAKLTVSFGKTKATLKQVHRAIRNKNRFVELDNGTQGILPEEWINKIAQYFQVGDIDGDILKIAKINFTEVEKLFVQEVLSEEAQQEINNYKVHFSDFTNIPVVKRPKELKAKLRDYQQEGLNWLNFLDNFNFGGCLADDMGLGKTLQIIAFILSQREKHGHRTNLIVVPTSLLFNWLEEIEKFAPSMKVEVHYGPQREKDVEELNKYEVVLTTYGMLLSDIRILKTFRFNYIFLDEAQAIKNPNSARYKAARLLQARNRVVLTGTPVENNTFDLYGQLSFACPGLLGSKQFFKDTYAIPIDQFAYNKRATELRRKINPFMLRRTKQQVAKELPQKTEMLIYCEMNAEQRLVYDTYERELREFISSKSDDEIQKSSMHVLTGLTKLRQICNSPRLLKEGYSGENAVKIEVIAEQIENKSENHKILVFSQFVEMLDLIRVELEDRKIVFEYLTGQTKNRGENVRNFQQNKDVRVFLISLKAGGVGLNLTEADYVYLVDPWWNPAVENQAIDRSYRIGQTKNVVAVRLICKDTVEEKIAKLQQKKRKLAQDLIATDATFFNQLSKSELLDIL